MVFGGWMWVSMHKRNYDSFWLYWWRVSMYKRNHIENDVVMVATESQMNFTWSRYDSFRFHYSLIIINMTVNWLKVLWIWPYFMWNSFDSRSPPSPRHFQYGYVYTLRLSINIAKMSHSYVYALRLTFTPRKPLFIRLQVYS